MKYIIYTILATALFSCSPKLSPDASWGRQRWVLVEMKGVPVQQSGGRQDAFISFEPGEKRFVGNGGCNQINGPYTLEKRTIKFGAVAGTKMSCPDIAFETAFLAALSEVDRYEESGNDLYLKKKNKILLILRAR